MHLLSVRLMGSRRARVGSAAGTWMSLVTHMVGCGASFGQSLVGPDLGKAASYGSLTTCLGSAPPQQAYSLSSHPFHEGCQDCTWQALLV